MDIETLARRLDELERRFTLERATSKWVRTQIDGISHRLNQQAAESIRHEKRADAMSRLYDEMGEKVSALEVTIGAMNERLDKASEAFVELRNSVKGKG